MTRYQQLQADLRTEPRAWLITGVAGFIGSHLLEALLQLGQRVTGLDNLSTGTPRNLDDVRSRVDAAAWERFRFLKGSVTDIGLCREASAGADFVLHQAGFVSVPLSIQDPVACHDTNATGTLNVLVAARDHSVRRIVLASSSAVYGDDRRLPNVEEQTGRPMSPYGATKLMGERFGKAAAEAYGMTFVALRLGWIQDGPNLPETLHDEWARQMWLSNDDLVQLFEASIEADLGECRFLVLNGMSNNEGMRWDLGPTVEWLDYQPEDDAFAEQDDVADEV